MDNDEATIKHLLLPEGILRDNLKATVKQVIVNFVDERGDLLHQALLTTVPRVGEEVELIIVPQIDQASLARLDLSKVTHLGVLKHLLGFRDKEYDAVEKAAEGSLSEEKIYNGTVLRVKWQWFVASRHAGVTIATVVLKLVQDGSFRADR
jgi:hypothetical protein